jgi:hypothetical protein
MGFVATTGSFFDINRPDAPDEKSYSLVTA